MNVMANSTKSAAAGTTKAPSPHGCAAQLKARAGDYYPGIDVNDVQVRLLRTSRRRYATLYEFELSSGETRRRILAKTPFSRRGGKPRDGQPQRPRLVPSTPGGEPALLEHRTLAAIQDGVSRLADPRFGAIRVLDLLADPYTIVMEKSGDVPLYRCLASARRTAHGAPCAKVAEAFRNTGAWLRQYHQWPPLEHTRPRAARRREVIKTIDQLTKYLHDAFPRQALLGQLRTSLAETARGLLPAHLPLGTSHGDFAPRNILVGAGHRVTVYDTRARWQAPIYEDLGYFLFALKASRLQVFTLGRVGMVQRLDDYQAEFIRGYFGDEPPPVACIRLFEGLTLLDKWVTLVHGWRTRRGAAKLAAAGQLAVFQRYASRYFDRLLPQLET